MMKNSFCSAVIVISYPLPPKKKYKQTKNQTTKNTNNHPPLYISLKTKRRFDCKQCNLKVDNSRQIYKTATRVDVSAIKLSSFIALMICSLN